MSNYFGGVGLWQMAGWTMLHFLWLGTLIGLAAIVLRLMLRRASPNVRYVVAIAVLGMLALLPVGIGAWLVKNQPSLPSPISAMPGSPRITADPSSDPANAIIELSDRDSSPPLERASSAPGSAGGSAATNEPMGATGSASVRSLPSIRTGEASGTLVAILESAVPYLPWVWFVGTPITFLLLTTGLVGSERLRRASRVIQEGPIAELAAHLRKTMCVGRHVSLAVCDRIAAPVLVGIVRPIILLPPAALTGWSPDEIEMVLLHELAHVRRWDNLVNLLQRCIESLLFFHPAVWLVSNWVRRERESCCDAVVVTRTNRPNEYAELLFALATKMPRFQAASAIAAGSLHARIRRILKLEDDPMLVSGKSFALVLGSLVMAATLAVLYLPQLGQAEDQIDAAAKTSPTPAVVTESSISTSLETGPSKAENELKTTRLVKDRDFKIVKNFSVKISAEELIREIDALIESGEVKGAKIGLLFPSQLPGDTQFKTLQAMRERCKEGKLADVTGSFMQGGDVVLLVYMSTDDWPNGVAFPTPKEAEISKQAWHILGIKIVSATQAERLARSSSPTISGVARRAHSLKVVGGVQAPPGSGSPIFLDRVGEIKTDDFDDLAIALAKFNEAESIVECIAPHAGFQVAITPRQYFGHPVLNIDSVSGKFPSLENQKLADLAWKRLVLELEAIDGDDLKRVQALGYEGGLKVSSIGNEDNRQGIQKDDILVGLHVWPTVSLKQVADILNRDDVAELNPLKYYVVRPGQPKSTGGGYGAGPEGDTVITGRITVQTNQTPRGARTSTSQQPAPPGTGFSPTQVNPWWGGKIDRNSPPQLVAPDRDVVRGPMPGPIEERVKSANASTKAQPSTAVRPGLAAVHPALSGAVAALENSLQTDPTRRLMVEQIVTGEQGRETPMLLVQSADRVGPPQVNSTDNPTDKKNLRYDGKTFDEWRSAWQTELSTEKRLEAIKALTAFGANGYGREAAEAILAVAAQYDWSTPVGNQAILPLKTACLDAFGGSGGSLANQLPREDALHVLLSAVESKDKATRQFVAIALRSYARKDEAAMKAIVGLTKTDDNDVNRVAWNGFVSVADQNSQPAQDRIREALSSGDPVQQEYGVLSLLSEQANGQSLQAYISEFFPLLFSERESLQQHARRALHSIDSTDAPQVVEKLIAELTDDKAKEKRLAAIRALAAAGQNAKAAIGRLREILASDAEEPVLVATAAAIQSIQGDYQYNKTVGEVLGDRFKLTVSPGGRITLPGEPDSQLFQDFDKARRAEQKQLFSQ